MNFSRGKNKLMKLLLNYSASRCCIAKFSKCHVLFRVREIDSWHVDQSDVELLSEMMPFITTPHSIRVRGKYCEVFNSELAVSLIESI